MCPKSSFSKTIHNAFVVFLSINVRLTTSRTSDEWIKVKKVTPDPVFVTVGQTLKLRLDIENLQVDQWNTTAMWALASDYSIYSKERELQLLRQMGSSNEKYYSYNKTRVSRERQIDLVLSSVTLADSGIYRCMFRRPPKGWSIWIHYNVIVEEEERINQTHNLQTVYVTRGDTLKLDPNLPDSLANSSAKNYETFWDFSSSFASRQEESVRIIGLTKSSVENIDKRASLSGDGTALVLKNTTLNDSGVYHLRLMKALSSMEIHKDFNVVVEDKPAATISCPRIVRLLEGENFLCLCEDTSPPDVTAQAFWLRDGQLIKHARPLHEEELYLANVTEGDAGLYTCRVRTSSKNVEVILHVFVSSAKPDMKAEETTGKHPAWYFLIASLAVGLLFGIVLVFIIQSFRRKCSPKTRDRQEVYQDVSFGNELELDVTSQYEDMNRASVNYQDVDSTSPYEVAILTCHAHKNQEMSPSMGMKELGVNVTPGYTDLNLDIRVRTDSHLYHHYQGLLPSTFAGNKG